jgi:hypothetical protein
MNAMSSSMTVVGPIGTVSGVLGPSGTFWGFAPATFRNSSRSFDTLRIRLHRGQCRWCEPQDFRFDDTEIIFSEYQGPERGDRAEYNAVTRGVNLVTGWVRTYIDETNRHNEPEGIFPDNEHICLQSSCDADKPYPPKDLWKLKLDGTMRRVRMTRMPDDHFWRAVNSNISPDGKTMAFMVGLQSDEAGYGRGIGLFDLQAWEKTPEAHEGETPLSRVQRCPAPTAPRRRLLTKEATPAGTPGGPPPGHEFASPHAASNEHCRG